MYRFLRLIKRGKKQNGVFKFLLDFLLLSTEFGKKMLIVSVEQLFKNDTNTCVLWSNDSEFAKKNASNIHVS